MGSGFRSAIAVCAVLATLATTCHASVMPVSANAAPSSKINTPNDVKNLDGFSQAPDRSDVELDGTIKISPATIEPEGPTPVKPGSSFTAKIKIRNRHPRDIVIRFDVAGLVGSDASKGAPAFRVLNTDDEAYSSSAAEWVKTPGIAVGAKLTLPPRTVTTVPIEVAVPKDAKPGGRYAALRMTTDSFKRSKESAVGIETELLVPILLVVSGSSTKPLDARVEIGDIQPSGRIRGKSRQEFSASIENASTSHASPEVRASLVNIFGRNTIRQNLTVGKLLPGAKTVLASRAWKAPWFGRYRVVLETRSPQQSKANKPGRWEVAGEVVVWVIPPIWVVIAVLLFVVLDCALLVKVLSASRSEPALEDTETDLTYEYDDDPEHS